MFIYFLTTVGYFKMPTSTVQHKWVAIYSIHALTNGLQYTYMYCTFMNMRAQDCFLELHAKPNALDADELNSGNAK